MKTDHKPSTYVMNSATERSSLCQTRHLAYIAEFTTDIRYIKGETNFVADALPRLSVSASDCDSVINYKDLSTDQAPRHRIYTFGTFNILYSGFSIAYNLKRRIGMVRCIDRTHKTVRN